MREIIIISLLTLFLITGCVQRTNIGELKKPIKGEIQEETKGNCTVGWKCLDQYKKGYQFSNCVFTQVSICSNGCEDGGCLSASPKEKKDEAFTLTEGIDTIKETGWKSCDFSEGQIFEDGVTNQDFKIRLYEIAFGYNHFRVESSEPSIWVINKGIADATRKDCIEKMTDAKSLNNLRSWQTLCIKTKENNIALVGGYWDGSPSEDTKLHWKYYS